MASTASDRVSAIFSNTPSQTSFLYTSTSGRNVNYSWGCTNTFQVYLGAPSWHPQKATEEMDRSHLETWFITENVRTNPREEGLWRTKNNVLRLVTADGRSYYWIWRSKDVGTRQIKLASMKMETCYNGIILQAGPMAWNALPDDLRDPSLSANNFRKRLKTHLFRNALGHSAH